MSGAPDLQLRSLRFREARVEDWRRLERVLAKLERGSLKALRDEELIALPALYRSTLSSLSTARAISLDRALTDYLEALCRRAYFAVYGVRTRPLDGVLGFLGGGWPRAVRALGPDVLAAALLGLSAALAVFVLVRADPGWFAAFMPSEMAGGRNPSASAETLRASLRGSGDEPALTVFASYLFTHNAQIALFAFALGFAFGLPTVMLLLVNGATLGALLAVYAAKGLAGPLLAWLLIHGVTELFAITLAGAAGLRIGRTLALPGDRTRLAALQEEGRRAAGVMAGVVLMLLCAGALEGYGRQLVQADGWRFAIAGATAVFWGVYFYAPWSRRA